MPTRKPRTPTPLPPNVIDFAAYRLSRGIPTPSEEKAALLRLMTEVRDHLRANPQPRVVSCGRNDVTARQQALIDASAALLAEAAWLREVHQ